MLVVVLSLILKDLDNSAIQITQTNPTISLGNYPEHYDVFLFPGDGRRGKWYVRVFQDPHPAGADSFQETHGQDHSSCGNHAHRYTFTDDWYAIVEDVMRNSAHRYTLNDDLYSIVYDVIRNSAHESWTRVPLNKSSPTISLINLLTLTKFPP